MGNICNVEPLQAQGTVVVDSAQSISSENPLQNKVVTIEKANASALCVDLSGNPITFNADSQAVQKLKVALEPIQDLHGYDKPWVGESGKNKLPLTVSGIKALNTSGTWNGNAYTKNGVTYTLITDDGNNITEIIVTDTASANSGLDLGVCGLTDSVIMNGCPTDGSRETYCLATARGTADMYDTGSGTDAFTSTTTMIAYIFINSGYSCPSGGLSFKPMIRLATESDATFASYTNYCPISGRTETGIKTEGKNICPVDSNSFTPSATWVSLENANANTYTNGTALSLKAGTYTISLTDVSNIGTIQVFNSLGVDIVNTSGYSATFTLSADDTIYIRLKRNNTDTMKFKAQIERGSSATAYVPYKTPVSCSIQFGQTVYGGTVDFKTGKVVVTKGTVELDGSNDENWSSDVVSGNNRFYCTNLPSLGYSATKTISASSNLFDNTTSSSYTSMNNVFILRYVNTQNRIDIMCNEIADLTAFKALIASTPLTICYELGTPIELTLTPSELQLLKGYNYITADGVMDLSLVPDNVIEYIMGQIISAMGTDESGRTTASRAYTTGEYFYKDGKMYKALTSIASGATFTVGTNCSQTTIFAELKNAQN